jgi:hypothetical protein
LPFAGIKLSEMAVQPVENIARWRGGFSTPPKA